MSVKRLDKIAWGRSGKPLAKSERGQMLAVIRRARREGRVRDPQDEKKGKAD